MSKPSHTPNEPSVRAAAADDLNRVEEIVAAAYSPYEKTIGFRPPPLDWDYAARLRAGRIYLAEVNGSVVGLVVLIPEEDCVLIGNVAVDPDHQGEGIGAFLLRGAEAFAHAADLPRVRLFTHRDMEANLALYRRLGFTEDRREGARVFLSKPVAMMDP